MSKGDYERKQVYVSRKIQGRIVSRLAGYWVTYNLVLWHAMFFYRYLLYRGQILADPLTSPVTFAEMYGSFMSQYYSMLLCAAAVFPLIFWDMMKLTHRVAGPLVRFTNTLKRLEAGDKVEPVRLRKGDLLEEFQDAFNSYLEKSGQLKHQHSTNVNDGEDEAVLAELKELSRSVAGKEQSNGVDPDARDDSVDAKEESEAVVGSAGGSTTAAT